MITLSNVEVGFLVSLLRYPEQLANEEKGIPYLAIDKSKPREYPADVMQQALVSEAALSLLSLTESKVGWFTKEGVRVDEGTEGAREFRYEEYKGGEVELSEKSKAFFMESLNRKWNVDTLVGLVAPLRAKLAPQA